MSWRGRFRVIFPAIGEKAVSLKFAASYRVVHITVFCLDIVHLLSKVCNFSEIGCIFRLPVKRKGAS
jgi:hypothetical protein